MLTKKSYPIEHTFYLSICGENKAFFTLKDIDDKTAEIIGKGLLAGNESERFYLSISKTTKTEYTNTAKTLSHITEEEKVISCYSGKQTEENTRKEYIRSYNWIWTHPSGHVFFTKVLKNAHTSQERPL